MHICVYIYIYIYTYVYWVSIYMYIYIYIHDICMCISICGMNGINSASAKILQPCRRAVEGRDLQVGINNGSA